MDIARIRSSRFLTKEDCGQGLVLTIDYVEEGANIGTNDEPENGFVLHFMEPDTKGMVLKPVNANSIADILGGITETDQWNGQQVMLFCDMSVSFGGKRMGGIRVRPAPAYQEPAAPVAPQRPAAARPAAPQARPVAAAPQRPQAAPQRPQAAALAPQRPAPARPAPPRPAPPVQDPYDQAPPAPWEAEADDASGPI